MITQRPTSEAISGFLASAERYIRKWAQGDEDNAGICLDKCDQRIDTVGSSGLASRRVVMVSQSIAPVKPSRILIGPKQRSVGPCKHWDFSRT